MTEAVLVLDRTGSVASVPPSMLAASKPHRSEGRQRATSRRLLCQRPEARHRSGQLRRFSPLGDEAGKGSGNHTDREHWQDQPGADNGTNESTQLHVTSPSAPGTARLGAPQDGTPRTALTMAEMYPSAGNHSAMRSTTGIAG